MTSRPTDWPPRSSNVVSLVNAPYAWMIVLVGARHPAGGVYGSQKCLPLPDVERQNNPVLQG